MDCGQNPRGTKAVKKDLDFPKFIYHCVGSVNSLGEVVGTEGFSAPTNRK